MPPIDPLIAGLVLGAYILLQIGIGVWFGRNVRTDEDYFLAGRRLGLWPIALSVFATWFGAETLVGSTAAIASEGLSGARAEPFGYALCLLAMAFLVAGQFRARGYVTLADFFRDRFDPHTERVAALVTVVVSVIWAAAQLLALASILHVALGWPQSVTLIVATLVVIVYTSFSGLMGDVVTDMVQSVVLIGGVLLVFTALAQNAGGIEPMLARIEPAQLAFVGPGESWLARIDAWAIPVLGSLITQEAISRFLAAKSPKLARHATLAAAALYLGLGSIPVLIGLSGAHLPGAADAGDAFLPRLAAEVLPPVLFLVFSAALLSAILSTVDSNLLSVSSMLTVNVMGDLHARASERLKLQIARATTIGAGLVALAIALSGQTIYELIALTSVFGQAGILVAVMFGMFSRFGGRRAAAAALWTCIVVNLATLVAWPIAAEMGAGATFGDAVVLLAAGEAVSIDGAFLISTVTSIAAYVAAALLEPRAPAQSADPAR
ncbi:MAG: sodium:solute symporter [Alphaproteobacteria bacterium]|nr:sodium:solute symporter [Alphaproteobacteria bacterium]